jgi:hypothetical protein
LSIDPDHLTLKLGQTTPSYVVSVLGSDGKSHEVQAALESMNANVLAADPDAPGRFVAKGYGATQVRAVFRGHEVFASVEVTGQRFDRVISTLDEGDRDFAVKVQVTAAKSEGALEYRLRVVGQPPPDQWIAARSAGDFQEVELHSPRMSYGPRDTKYPLVIEARAASGGPVQQYPLTFQLKTRIEETK